ncbi:single-stranded DNA-binding protein [Candidatus Gottesmanbacteria bacterium]|nr:single-stranded DNA-binding protein [Candidatus Gottesmanbacteria bacterium]
MSSRSLNKVILIGNLTRDPELRYTPAGTAVCTMGVATNRSWTTQSGDTKEETEFHRVVAWNKLAELCAQLLTKGRKVYVEGRLATHSWTAQDGAQRSSTEVVIEDMIILDSRKKVEGKEESASIPERQIHEEKVTEATPVPAKPSDDSQSQKQTTSAKQKTSEKKKEEKAQDTKETPVPTEDITPEDIPF